MKKRIKLLIVLIIVLSLGWFLFLSPYLTFKGNEKLVEKAARDYYEINAKELPTGNRVKTISLKKLYHNKFLEKDIYVPFSKKNCSLDKSWVKVRRVDNEYQYYTYLDCNIIKSSVDSVGPSIQLKGDSSISLGVGDEYKELGIKSVSDNTDGKMKNNDVEIKSNVDTSKIGTYQVTYTAFDSLNNKTIVTRQVKVIQKLYNTVKKVLGEEMNFKGSPANNYIRLSNMLYQVYGVDDNKNVIIVSAGDVANVNHSKIDKWLDYYYEHLNDKTKKMIVSSKYCNMNVEEANLATLECNSYTKQKKVYIPSIVEVNKAQLGDDNFMKPGTMSWVSNKQDDKKAYLTREVFFYDEKGKSFLTYDVTDNYGVRPMMVIRGDSLIQSGDGTVNNPYVFGDSKVAKGGSLLNKRSTGEYIYIKGIIFRIIDVMTDGTVKVISNTSIGADLDDMVFTANPESDKITYNPNNKTSVAYAINNRVSEYVDTSYFEKHEIEVPIYKNKIIYGEEESTKKYEVMLSAPNMYEMFSAMSSSYQDSISLSYWLLNTSKGNRIAGAIYDAGVPVNESIGNYEKYGARVVGYLKSNVVVKSGKGTIESPYQIN